MRSKVKKGLNIYIWSCLVIVIGFVAVAVSNWTAISKIVNDDLEKSTELMTVNLNTAIQNELGKPTVVAGTMASDTYLVQWLKEEHSGVRTVMHKDEIKDYLNTMKDKNGYSSAYVISADTLNYYYTEGLKGTLDAERGEDKWYFDFIQSGKEYDLRVDEDELNDNVLSVFINAKIIYKDEDEIEHLMGIIGVALPMELFQNLFQKYQEDYDIKACMVNDKGIIEVEPGINPRRRVSIYQKWKLGSDAIRILKKQEGNNTYTYYVDGAEHCVVSLYIKELDWYLYIQEISNNSAVLNHLMNRNFFIMAIVLTILLGVDIWLIYRDNKLKEKRMTIDPLTEVHNRNYFLDYILPKAEADEVGLRYIIIFDIDCFKMVNDTRGHNVGDQMLKMVASVSKKQLEPFGEVVRWGGDEFIVLATATHSQIEQVFTQIQQKISQENITISMGAARYETDRDISQIIDRADQALYQRKRNGRNGVTFYE